MSTPVDTTTDPCGDKQVTSQCHSWMCKAVVSWISGLIFGCIVAAIVVTTGAFVFPELEELGIDLGNQLKVTLDQVDARVALGPAEKSRGISGYVFVDLDPGGIRGDDKLTASERACILLMANDPKLQTYALESGERARESGCTNGSTVDCVGYCDRICAKLLGSVGTNRQSPSQSGPLNCSQHRSLNRYLIARAISTIAAFAPKAIVIDVVLYDDPGVFSTLETEELRSTFSSVNRAPLFYARPFLYQASPLLEPLIREDTVAPLLPNGKLPPNVKGLPNFPASGHITRAYPNCYHVISADPQTQLIASLPYAVATNLAGLTNAKCALNRGQDTPRGGSATRRIIFTLPDYIPHVDNEGESEVGRAAKYRPVYERCLVENLWSPKYHCSNRETYQGKVVVLGTSNVIRNDRFTTSIGQMPGALLTINAIRSYVLYEAIGKAYPAKIVEKLFITFVCSLVWLAYWMLWYRRRRVVGSHRIGAILLEAGYFVLSVLSVCIVAIWLSFDSRSPAPNLDILIPILAIGLEIYGDGAKWLKGIIETLVHSLSTRLAR